LDFKPKEPKNSDKKVDVEKLEASYMDVYTEK